MEKRSPRGLCAPTPVKGLHLSSRMHLVSPVKCLPSQLWQGGLKPHLTTQQLTQVETGKRICWRQSVLRMVMQPAALRAVCLCRAKHQQEEFEKDRKKKTKETYREFKWALLGDYHCSAAYFHWSWWDVGWVSGLLWQDDSLSCWKCSDAILFH